MRILIVLLLLLAAPLRAELSYPKYSRLGSQLGPITVQQLANGQQQVNVANSPIAGLTAIQVYLHGVYNHKAVGSQTVLLSLRHGTAGCLDSWALIRISGNQVLPTAPFGGCAEIPRWLESDGLGLELGFSHPDPQYAATVFRFDAQGLIRKDTLVTELQNEEGSGDGGLPELDWAKWIGRASSEFLQDPLERFRFQYVSSEELEILLQQMQISGALFSDGAYLYGYGCVANPCNKTHAAFSISISYGYPRYVFHDKNGQRKSGGDILSRFPERLRQFYYTGVFNQ